MELKTTRGTILFAHGSRDPLWRLPIEAVATHIQALEPDALVRCAYLELTTPDLASTAAELISLGATALTVVPMFLGVGRHAREDLPQLMVELQAQHPQVSLVLKPAIGEHPQITALMAEIAMA